MTKPVIQVCGLRKVYQVGREQVVALDNIDFTIESGQVCCIVGTSGSGKSTLLNQLAGLEKPTRGKVLIDGHNISAFSENQLARFRQKKIGFVFQSYNLIPSMTALENVSMPLIFRGMPKGRREKAARRILKEVGLGGRIRHTPAQMSGGQQQRVGIARAFVARPRLVFADEPTGNLDSRTTIEVMRMMVRLCRENDQTLVLVTHDVELAHYADRIITILDGKIVKDVKNESLVDTMSEEEAIRAFEEAARAAAEAELEQAAQERNAGHFPQGQENRPVVDTITIGQTEHPPEEETGAAEEAEPEGTAGERFFGKEPGAAGEGTERSENEK